MGRSLPLARDDDADIGHGQRGVRQRVRGTPVRDVDALGGVATDVGWATRGRGLDDVTARFQSFLPLVQHSVKSLVMVLSSSFIKKKLIK